jgi:hypothetical protein
MPIFNKEAKSIIVMQELMQKKELFFSDTGNYFFLQTQNNFFHIYGTIFFYEQEQGYCFR